MLFGIDAAAISLVFAGAASGTLGSSGVGARAYDELQFTFGEGPCLDSVARRAPVLIADLANGNGQGFCSLATPAGQQSLAKALPGA